MDELREGGLLRDQFQPSSEGKHSGADGMDEQLAVCCEVAYFAVARADEPAATALVSERCGWPGAKAGTGDGCVARGACGDCVRQGRSSVGDSPRRPV